MWWLPGSIKNGAVSCQTLKGEKDSDLPTREEGTAERSLCVTSFVAFNLSSAPAHSIERVREEAGKVASRAHWPYSCDGRNAGIKETSQLREVIGRFLSIVFREAAEL